MLPLQQADEVLEYHNKVRSEIEVGPPVWSSQLADFAQKWANNLISNEKWNL